MKQGFARLGIVLDRSGSMKWCLESTITGFNKFINDQKAIPGECLVTLWQFDSEFEHVYTKPLLEVPEMTQATFVPRGSTALVYAQGRAITELGEQLDKMPEAQKPDRVCIMTLTDGEENYSHHFVGEDKKPIWTVEKLAALIKQQQDVYHWDFFFLAANQDAVKVGAAMNIQPTKAMSFQQNDAGINNTMNAASNYMRAYRASQVGGQCASEAALFSDEDRKAAMAGDQK